MFRCGLWASSGPFPLSAHYGLYMRGRDPPTNPSRHLKKERSSLPLKWLLKEDQGRRPTAATTAAALLRAAAVPAASPCRDHVFLRADIPTPPPQPLPYRCATILFPSTDLSAYLHHHRPASITTLPSLPALIPP